MRSKFVNDCLTNVEWDKEIEWLVSGIIKKRSNETLKFDIRNLKEFKENIIGKLINSKNPSDKILFEDNKKWILIDTKEFIEYMEKNKIKKINLKDLVLNLEWNIIINK
jgi:hypothetical protein